MFCMQTVLDDVSLVRLAFNDEHPPRNSRQLVKKSFMPLPVGRRPGNGLLTSKNLSFTAFYFICVQKNCLVHVFVEPNLAPMAQKIWESENEFYQKTRKNDAKRPAKVGNIGFCSIEIHWGQRGEWQHSIVDPRHDFDIHNFEQKYPESLISVETHHFHHLKGQLLDNLCHR